MKPIDELLPEYLLDAMPEARRRALDEALAASPALRREVDGLAERLALAAARALAPVDPPAALRDRLLANSRPSMPWHPFTGFRCAHISKRPGVAWVF